MFNDPVPTVELWAVVMVRSLNRPREGRCTHRCHRQRLLLGRYARTDLLSPGAPTRSARKSSQVR
jgi:hypothetical protein